MVPKIIHKQDSYSPQDGLVLEKNNFNLFNNSYCFPLNWYSITARKIIFSIKKSLKKGQKSQKLKKQNSFLCQRESEPKCFVRTRSRMLKFAPCSLPWSRTPEFNANSSFYLKFHNFGAEFKRFWSRYPSRILFISLAFFGLI